MRKNSGFTLIELMVAISVLAILLAVGVPSMIDFLQNNRRAAAVNSLVSDLQQARNSAATLGLRVVLCHSDDGTSCSNGGTPDWSAGWILFVDDNQNGVLDATDRNAEFDGGEALLSMDEGREGLTIPSSTDRFIFNPGFNSGINAGVIAVCIDGPGGDDDRWVVIGPTGRPRLVSQYPGLVCT